MRRETGQNMEKNNFLQGGILLLCKGRVFSWPRLIYNTCTDFESIHKVYITKCYINFTHEEYPTLLIGCICLLAFAVMPAQAFTAKALTISLDTNGNAQVDFQYDLSFTEQAAIFFNIANPSAELATALENNLNRQVTVVKTDSSSAEVIIPSFATISQSSGAETMTTPAFSFANAQNAIRQYLVVLAHLGRSLARCDDHHVP